MNEPVPLFQPWDEASFFGVKVTVLSVKTYCTRTDKFLLEPLYKIKRKDNSRISYDVKERDLDLWTEN